MKLDALHDELPVAHSHDLIPVRPCGDLEALGKGLSPDKERMISRRLKGIGKSLKNRPAVVMDRGGLPVHEPGCTYDLPAKGRSDGLMTETYP